MRLELDARTRALLRRLPRANVYSLLELLLLALLAVQCARLVWTVATPVNPLGQWQPARLGFAGAPGDVLRGFDPFFRLSGENQASTVTSLQLVLFGTTMNEATGLGSAIIATPDQVQDSYAVGDEIMPGVKLKSVAYDHVTIDRGGSSEDLFIDQSDTVTPVTPTVLPSQNTLDLIGNEDRVTKTAESRGVTLADIRAGIGFIPRIDNGRVTGLVVRPSGSGDVFNKADLQSGDIVTQIAGHPVTGQADIESVAASLKNGGILSLSVERGAKVVPIGITVTGP